MKHSDMRRFGVVAPAGNMAIEYEFSRHVPNDILFNHARANRPGGVELTVDSLREMGEHAIRSAMDLVRSKPEIILYACTSGSFVDGDLEGTRFSDQITELTGIPSITTFTAVIHALRAVAAQRVFMITPYPEDITRTEAELLERNGFEMVGFAMLPCDANYTIGSVDSEDTLRLALENRDRMAQADTLFISCTNLLTLDKIAELERQLGVAVVTSNSASLWAVMRHMNRLPAHAAIGTLASCR